MFDRLDDILIHYEEIMQELGEPNVTENQDLLPQAHEGAG